MPNLSTQEINEFNAIKPQLKALWEDCNIINKEARYIPNIFGKRLDIIPWMTGTFDRKTVDNLLQFQAVCQQITVKLLKSSNSDNTKVKKLTIYRKMIAEMLREDYEKHSYNMIPYALFSFPEDSIIVAEINNNYTNKVKNQNTGDNRVNITKDIIIQLIENAVNDLRKNAEVSRDYGSKMLALELLIGRRQYEEILNNNCDIEFNTDGNFLITGLAKSSEQKKQKAFKLPYLGQNFEQFEGELSQLLSSNLKLLRNFAKEKSELKTPLPTLLNTLVLQASLAYDRILKPVRMQSNLEPINGKTHLFRKLYAFSCYALIDGCKSNESQYFAQVLAEGSLNQFGELNLGEITAKSYCMFRLVDELN